MKRIIAACVALALVLALPVTLQANLNVATLDAISADLGTVTAGSITGVTISGSSIYGGSGNEVTLDADGLTIVDWASDDKNALKWSGGSKIFGFSDTLALRSGSGAGVNVIGTDLVEVIGKLYSNSYAVQFTTLGGGGTRYVCVDNAGNLFAASSC